MTTVASQITSLTVVYSTVYSDADQRKHQSSASLAFVWGNSPGPVNSPHKGPVTRKMFPFDDVIMKSGRSSNPQASKNTVLLPKSFLVHQDCLVMFCYHWSNYENKNVQFGSNSSGLFIPTVVIEIFHIIASLEQSDSIILWVLKLSISRVGTNQSIVIPPIQSYSPPILAFTPWNVSEQNQTW